MKRVIAYLRVSTEAQDEIRQLEQIEKYCLENNYDIVRTISEKVSGAKSDREGVIQLLSLNKEDADIIIISETSRLSREDDYLKLLNNVNTILQGGIDVLFLDGLKHFKNGKNLSLFDIIQLSFEAKANSDERKKISVRCLTGRKSKAKQGCYVGGFIPLGYTSIINPLRIGDSKEHGTSLLIIDKETRPIIELVFDLVANRGYTLKNTAIFLNDSGYKFHGKDFYYSAIGYIIHNPIYTGAYLFAGETSKIDAIITKELFDKAQLQLKINTICTNTGKKNYNILKGLVKCPCGCSLTFTKKTEGNTYYQCTKKYSNAYINYECCNTGVNAPNLNRIVWKVVQAFINKTDFKLKTEQASKNINLEVEQLESKITKQAVSYDLNETEIESTLNLLLSCTEAEKVYINRKFALLVENQTELKEQIKELNTKLTKLISKKKDFTLNLESELMANLTDIEKNVIYKKYISTVTYYSVTRFKGFIVIDFKNGFKSIISYLSRITLTAYELPQNCTFNAETRKVICSLSDYDYTAENIYTIPANYTKELTYQELEKDYYLPEYLMQL